MALRFDNDSSKQWLARKGPAKVFGMDVDQRETLSDMDAIKWFDKIWKSSLATAIQHASLCDIDFVRSKVPHYAHGFILDDASHREFTLANCLFICQLTDNATCNQLWFIPSTSGDPRTLYVKFETVPIKEKFDEIAKSLGWQKPEVLAEKLLLDFMSSVRPDSTPAPQADELDDI